MTTFTVVNEDTLAAAVDQSRERLVYIAPGITAKIVAAMAVAMQGTQPPPLTVIIDTDPEVCRLGYGTVEGLKALQAAGQMLPIRYQRGCPNFLCVRHTMMTRSQYAEQTKGGRPGRRSA